MRGKPGQWATVTARPVDRVQRDKMAEQALAELQKQPGVTSVSMVQGHTLVIARKSAQHEGIELLDCRISRRKIVADA